jgi:NAD(P)-dependent dehydrogenase (short-subunit alcohol dehydrogenase family)
VITSPNGMGCIRGDHPLALGFIGRNGAYPANEAGRRCDLVLTLGTRFDDRSASSWHAGYSWNFPSTKLVHVDIDPQELGRNYAPTLGVIADVKVFTRQLLTALDAAPTSRRSSSRPGATRCEGWQREWEAFVRPHFGDSTSPLRPEFVVGTLQKLLPDDVILALDSGVHHNWFMQFWQARRPQSMLNSWGYSSMGFGVCGVMGAQLAAPTGRASPSSATAASPWRPTCCAPPSNYNLPVVWIVWNNFAWGAIRDLQYGLFDGREIGTAFYKGQTGERYNPDFAAWARACGADGYTVTRPQELGRRGRTGAEEQAALRDRRARRRRRAPALHRHLAAAADSVQGTGVRQALAWPDPSLSQDPDMSNKIALVFGGSRGIGAACVQAWRPMASTSPTHTFPRRPTPAPARAARRATPPTSATRRRSRVFDAVSARLRRPAALRGGQRRHQRAARPDGQFDPGNFRKLVEVNIVGAFNVLAEAARQVQDGGSIIALTTSMVRHAAPGLGPYSATKAAVESHGALDGQGTGGRKVRVNAVAPGPVDTDLFRAGKTTRQAALGGDEPVQPRRRAAGDRRGGGASWRRSVRRGLHGQVVQPNGGLV